MRTNGAENYIDVGNTSPIKQRYYQASPEKQKLMEGEIKYNRIPEMLGRFLNLNKIKTERISNHVSEYFIHSRTSIT